jgi:cytochrome c biogenesis protein CcdA
VNAAHLTGKRRTVLLAVLTYALALSAATFAGPNTAAINVGVEGVSSGVGTVLGGLGAVLPLGYAFGAGMVAAVNPCGFALLPAYIALYLGGREAERTRSSGLVLIARAARIGLTMSAGFTVLFAVAGLLLGIAATTLVRLFPWVGLVVGVSLVALGARLAGGTMVYASLGERIADRLGGRARRRGAGHYFIYGLAYGAASLSCTLPIFLAVVGSAFTSGDYVAATLQFLLYAFGMGVVVIGVTLGIALFRDAVVTRAREAMRYVQPASAAFLLLAGAYIIYYWLTLGGLLAAVHLA